jgi:hypothetical protein
MLLPVWFVKTKGRQNCRPLQLDLCAGPIKMIVFLSSTARKRLSYKDNASEKGKSIIDNRAGGKKKSNRSMCEVATQEELDFKFLI